MKSRKVDAYTVYTSLVAKGLKELNVIFEDKYQLFYLILYIYVQVEGGRLGMNV